MNDLITLIDMLKWPVAVVVILFILISYNDKGKSNGKR